MGETVLFRFPEDRNDDDSDDACDESHEMKSYEGRLVRIHRKAIERHHLDGYVIASTPRLLLLQPVRERLDLDGYDVVRAVDISRVSPSPKAAFYEEALALKRIKPRKPRGIVLDDMKTLLASLQDRYPLVVIHRERRVPDECEVGRIRALTNTTYRLDWMTPTAEWEDDERVFKLADVTRVQFDGTYENTLADVAAARAQSCDDARVPGLQPLGGKRR